MGYIDIHAHILPGLDDGPETIEDSKRMLHKAYDEGFTTIIATPHCSKGFRSYTIDEVLLQCEILKQYARENISQDFIIFPGQEINFNASSMELIREGKVIPIAGSKYILLEFDPDITFSNLLAGIREASMSRYMIILAHIERYRCLYNFKRLNEIRKLGILTQMNYEDIGGKWYRRSTVFCRKCLYSGVVDFLGTDMHDVSTRSSKSNSAFKWMYRNLEPEDIERITKLNARQILSI